ncbi:tetratricopeptide repeat protein [Massilia sp. TWR1-2-2]|uniref:tetratricopeptide repeat protein n=1 Tax=Massilia sp. TWR1-2-2 TaxID=2804584 RepID=UPI003CF932CA
MTGQAVHIMRAIAALAMLAAACRAQDGAAAPPAQLDELYRAAMQSIAEGRKGDASEALMRVVDIEPKHAGAWLDLALIQCGLGHSDEAERLFAAIETRFNPPSGILEVIAEARDSGCSRWNPTSSSSLTLGRGYDRNVNQGASNPNFVVNSDGIPIERQLLAEFLPQADRYSVLSGEYMRDATANGTVGFAQMQFRHNDHLSRYNSGALFAGVETPWRFGRWTLRTTALLGAVSLGGQFYQRHAQAQARFGPPLSLPAGMQLTVLAGINHTEYLTLTNFDANTVELRPQLTWRGAAGTLSASAGYLRDMGQPARPGGDRRGLMANVVGRRSLAYGMTGELALTRQQWIGSSAYLPGLIEQTRQQDTSIVRANLSYPISKRQLLQLEVRAVRNRENISIFQYNNRQVQLSWQLQSP